MSDAPSITIITQLEKLLKKIINKQKLVKNNFKSSLKRKYFDH